MQLAREWLKDHQAIVGWMTVASLVTFIASLVLVPFVIARIPADYFLESREHPLPVRQRHPVILFLGVLLKNLLGVVLILGGIAMLVLPGQGVLTILIGASLLNFPGKRRLELWVIRKPAIHRAINWLRKRSGHAPLQLPTDFDDSSGSASPDEPATNGKT